MMSFTNTRKAGSSLSSFGLEEGRGVLSGGDSGLMKNRRRNASLELVLVLHVWRERNVSSMASGAISSSLMRSKTEPTGSANISSKHFFTNIILSP